MKCLFSLAFIFSTPIFASAPCGGAQVGYWTNQDGSRGGWVATTAKVESGAFIGPHAEICEYSIVKSGAKVSGYAKISGRASILAGSEIKDRAKVQGEANIGGSPSISTTISGDVIVEGRSQITGLSHVYARAIVRNGKVHNSYICQASVVEGIQVTDSNYYCQTEDPEPKHPGELGKKTLLGVDSDRDGVRDDVEIWINERFSNTPEKDMFNYRQVFKQFAISKMKILKNKTSKSLVMQAASEGFDAMSCMDNLFVDKSKDLRTRLSQMSDNTRLRKEFEEVFFNTKDRLLESMKSGKHLHGETLTSANKAKQGCYFEAKK